MPNQSRTRIIEVGIRVDFIANTLVEAIKSDPNIVAMSLYAPDGTPFETFSNSNVIFENQKKELPEFFTEPVSGDEFHKFYTKVNSSHPRCCQCDFSGTSKNGEYYYVLETRVSRSEIKALQAKAGLSFLLIGLGNGLLSLLLARLLSRRLVRNIEAAVKKVRKIKDEGSLTDRIGLKADDEISFLTQEFDLLLDFLEESQKKVIAAEKMQSKVELAKVVAQNIRSPALAIEMMLPGLINVPERLMGVLKNSVKEIKQLSDKLKLQADSMSSDHRIEGDSDFVFMPIFLEDLVRQKEIEFSGVVGARVMLETSKDQSGTLVIAASVELRGVLSKIINNARESYSRGPGPVVVSYEQVADCCVIRVKDQGADIPSECIGQLGSRTLSLKCGLGRGSGLYMLLSL